MIKGAIFCQVIKIKLFIQFSPSITFGNQKWKGAIPVFIINEEEIIKLIIKFLFIMFKFHSLIKENKIMENNKILEAKACVKKYFNEASEDKMLFVFIIKGIKDNRLISNPIQILSHEDEQIAIIVPKIKVIKKIIL